MICHNRSLATTAAAARLLSVHQSLGVGGSCRQIVNIPTRSTSKTAAALSLSPIVRKNPFCLRRRHHNVIFRHYLSQNLHLSCSFGGGTTKIFLRNNHAKIKRYFATLGSPKNNINNNNNVKLSRRQRRKQERYQQKQERKNKNKIASTNNSRNNNSNDALSSSSSSSTTTTTTNRFTNIITSLRNLGTLESSTKTKLWEGFKRFPFFVALVILASWDETSPFVFEQTLGPSMLPTIHPMGDLYVRQTHWLHNLTSSYQVGDIVIFQKEASDNYYSCKRIIGMEGQQVLVYGQYVHLFQDRTDKGIIPMDQTNIEQQEEEEGQQLPFALQLSNNNKGASSSADVATNEGIRCTFTIPPGHVWVEGDNPLDSLDSRHYGPIPLSALRGCLVMRLWPLWRSKQQSQSNVDQNQDQLWMSRYRPTPLSRQHLLNDNYNLHPRPTPA